MNRGTRKSYNIKKDDVIKLEYYTSIFLHNKGGSPVFFGDIEIKPSEKHTVNCHGVSVCEAINIVFTSNTDKHLYFYVVSVFDCT